ncbi:hypothetical protein ZYGR_0AF03500 [Zygosaccharomyces rouxii]|uniref:mRNA export factor GLE1 n=1 Tax=Zygosaccharomyces rouxii TaxID=4956 RepID=A0A1Q3A818_ZYGRO|nr:hypothetical protein ZYGR_0AF03500 [Zygosaccharomyces rouxii]
MRFVFDELYDISDDEDVSPFSTAEPSPDEYTFVNEKEVDIPRLMLPRQHKRQSSEASEKLDAETEQLLSQLNLRAKLPTVESIPMVVPGSSGQTGERRLENSVPPSVSTTKRESSGSTIAYDTKDILSALTNSLVSKMNQLDIDNSAQVQSVRAAKRKAEEDRRRKEEEALRYQEELAKRRREEEDAKKRQLEEQRKRQEAERKLKEEKEQQEQRSKSEREKALMEEQARRGKAVTDFKAIEKTFWHYKDKILQIKKEIVEPVKKMDVETRNLISRHKRKINPKFGQLTNSNQQLQSIQMELFGLIDQTKSNQLAYLWVLNFIAKALVHQSETEVRVKPESALPLAKLTLALMIKYPELKELLMARWVKKCPFVIGYTCKIDTEQGRSNMGWKRNSDDKWEEDTSYDERMGGMVTLFAVITRLPLSAELIHQQQHPLPISHSWRLLARIANTSRDLLTNSHFVVLGSWWDAAASQFHQAYSKQAQKLLQLVGDNLTSAVAEQKYVGAARLRILMEEWQTTGIKSFPEMIE